MAEITIISSYRNRSQSLLNFCKSIQNLDRKKFDIIIVSLGDENQSDISLCRANHINFHYVDYHDTFNTGMGHNIGVNLAKTKWILKQDIDCVCEDVSFYHTLNTIKNDFSDNDFLNIGVFYNEIQKATPYGNEFFFTKSLWEKIGGSPNTFVGYGWEDYAVLYHMEKIRNPEFRLSYDKLNCNSIIRDQLARIKNKEAFEKYKLFLIHKHHQITKDKNYMNRMDINKNELFKYIQLVDLK